MIIIDLSAHESDFCRRSTIRTGADIVRSLDIDNQYALFIYYFKDHIHLSFSKYDQESFDLVDWKKIERIPFIYPDLVLDNRKEMRLTKKEDKILIELPIDEISRKLID